jgi:hypothetical protein
MDMAGYENGAVIMGGLVFLFASGSYQVGKKCKPATPKITQGQS